MLVLHLRLAIKLQAEVFHEKCHGIMNDPKQPKQDISSTRGLLLLVRFIRENVQVVISRDSIYLL